MAGPPAPIRLEVEVDMALLTAEDVLNKAFSKTKYREGFDQDEVDDFLDEVAHTITQLTAERDELAARLRDAPQGAAAPVEAPSADAGLLQAATDPTPPTPTLVTDDEDEEPIVTLALDEAEEEDEDAALARAIAEEREHDA